MSTPPSLELPDGTERVRLSLTAGPLAALEAAPAQGVPFRGELICVPGFTGSKEDFLPLLEPLSRVGVRVLAIDQRGQCDSPGLPARRPYTLRGYGQELRELIEQRAASGARPHLLAHSFGGYVARQALFDGPPLPLASLTMLGTGPGAVPRPAADRVRFFLAVSTFVSPVRGNRMLLLDRHRDPLVQAFLRHRIKGNDTRSLRAIARWLLSEPDRVDQLAAVLRRDALPCFVMCGADERTWRVPTQRHMAQRLGAPFAAVPHAGHSVNVEQPAEVVARLLDFWAGLERAGEQGAAASEAAPRSDAAVEAK
ncbi:alpha/beta hydrolase [Actinospica durhamensis]|uniref:Alpha/beta hydrolase n=1 Tax=Actinospica durhamensis TaxID=1508375 RepID=A0A941EWY6_9ACTN|nr:alpha/beta hydrolase [Actinospica durhamensis]MBR7837933.1 alpha/beta hydrolase [Actinospica durhamensis]